MSFYANDSVAALATDIVLDCGKLFVNEFLVETTGVMGTPGATAAIVLASGVSADDVFNNKKLFIQDNNNELATVNIDDSDGTANTITVDTTASLLIKDGVTAGSFTAADTYNLYILDVEEFVGFSTQSLDQEEEVVEFLDCNEKIRDDVTKVILGFSGDCKNLSADKTFANVYGLTIFGSQTGQKQFHGGFTPPTKTFFLATLKTENVVDKALEISMFKGQFFANGGVEFGAAGEYKVVPYMFKAVKDPLRDTGAVNAWSVTETT